MKNCLIMESAISNPITNLKKTDHTVEFTATLQEADEKNRNGRIYPREVLDEAIHTPYVQERLQSRTLFGEAGHPLSQDLMRQTTIDPRNIAFLIEDLYWEGDMLKARCQTADTAEGRDMAGLITENGSTLSFSLRAQGNIVSDPIRQAKVVQSPLMIITWDWVITPSHQHAVMDRFSVPTSEAMFNYGAFSNNATALTESMDVYENGKIVENTPVMDYKKIDYSKYYGFAKKPISEIYIPSDTEILKSLNESTAVVMDPNSKTEKIVAADDYMLKSIRKSISKMNEDLAGIAPISGPIGAPIEKQFPTENDFIDGVVSKDKAPIDTVAAAADVSVTPAGETVSAVDGTAAGDAVKKEVVSAPSVENVPTAPDQTKIAGADIKEGSVEPVSTLGAASVDAGVGSDGEAKVVAKDVVDPASEAGADEAEKKDDELEKKDDKLEKKDDSLVPDKLVESEEADDLEAAEDELEKKDEVEAAPVEDHLEGVEGTVSKSADIEHDQGLGADDSTIVKQPLKDVDYVDSPDSAAKVASASDIAKKTLKASTDVELQEAAADLLRMSSIVASVEHLDNTDDVLKELLKMNDDTKIMSESVERLARSLLKKGTSEDDR